MNNHRESKVTVVTPCYNQGHYLEECLRSVIGQTYPHWQVIVVDDASPDSELIHRVVEEVGNPRIRIATHDRNRGLAASRNTGIRQSTTEFVLGLDADDMIAEDCLEQLVPVLSADPKLDCVFPDCQLFGRRNYVLEFYGPPPGKKLLRPEDTIPGAGTMMRRSLWERLGGYDESEILRLGREDFEFWIRAFHHGCRAKRVKKPLYLYRIAHTSMATACRSEDDRIAKYIHDKNKEVFETDEESRQFLSYFYQHAALASYFKHERGKAFRLAVKAFTLTPSRSKLVSIGKTVLPASTVRAVRRGEARRTVPFVGYPLRSAERYRPFFIIGVGRSGNTLLRRILTAHSTLFIPPETFVLGTVIQQFKRYGKKMNWPELVHFVYSHFEFHPEFHTFDTWLGPLVNRLLDVARDKRNLAYLLHQFYKFLAEHEGNPEARWGDKTPMNSLDDNLVIDSEGTVRRWIERNDPASVGQGVPETLERIRKVFPDAQFVHIYRDGCDVAASFIRGGFVYDIEDAGYRWLHVARQTRHFVEKYPEHCFQVRYEDLVSDPESTAGSLCQFLGVEFEADMLASHEQAEELGDVPEWFWHKQVAAPINPSNPGKGRRYLTSESKEKLHRIIGAELEYLGYPPVSAEEEGCVKMEPETI